MTYSKKCSLFAYSIGIFFVIIGLLIGFIWPLIFDLIWREKLALSPVSNSYKLWVKTPMPLYMDVYLFNWTNSKEFMKDKSLKPEFKEIGPFVFKEVHERVNVKWNYNYTVTYNQTRTWHFVPEQSLDLSVRITNLNVVLTTIIRMTSNRNFITKELIDFLSTYYKEELIITREVREWLFDGMDDSLLDFIRKHGKAYVPFKKFGWFYERNMSSAVDGKFNVKTGQDNIYNLGMIDYWNGVNKTNYYDGECAVVKGSSGELFPPLADLQSNLSIFITDFCGPITLNYVGETAMEGLSGYHYVGDKSTFDNGTLFQSSKCFCSGECSPSGVRNVTSCRQAPLFISFPHFYLADSVYTDAIVGMRPNKKKHELYIKINPLTGIPLDIRAQFQVNVLLEPHKFIHLFKNVPKIYVPMLWFTERAKITPDLASQCNMVKILGSLKFGLGLAFGLAGIGFLIILIRLFIVHFYSKTKNHERLKTENDECEEEPTEENNSNLQ